MDQRPRRRSRFKLKNRPRRRTPAAVIGVFGCAALFEQIVKNLLVVDDPRSKTSKRNLTCVIRDVCSLRIALANKKKFPLPHEEDQMKKLWGDVNRLHVGLRCPNKVRRLPGDVSNLKRLKAPQFRCLAYIFDQNPNYTGSPLRLIRQLPRSLRTHARKGVHFQLLVKKVLEDEQNIRGPVAMREFCLDAKDIERALRPKMYRGVHHLFKKNTLLRYALKKHKGLLGLEAALRNREQVSQDERLAKLEAELNKYGLTWTGDDKVDCDEKLPNRYIKEATRTLEDIVRVMREIHFLNGSTTFKVLMDGSQLPARRRRKSTRGNKRMRCKFEALYLWVKDRDPASRTLEAMRKDSCLPPSLESLVEEVLTEIKEDAVAGNEPKRRRKR